MSAFEGSAASAGMGVPMARQAFILPAWMRLRAYWFNPALGLHRLGPCPRGDMGQRGGHATLLVAQRLRQAIAEAVQIAGDVLHLPGPAFGVHIKQGMLGSRPQ